MFVNWLNFFTDWLHIKSLFHRTLLITKNNNSSQENIHHFVGGFFLPNLITKKYFLLNLLNYI